MSLKLMLLAKPSILGKNFQGDIPLTKPAALLCFLACRADWVSRSELAFLFSADVPEKTAKAYLRQLVFRAKQYAWAEGLEVSETHLRWLVATDLKSFHEALKNKQWQEALLIYRAGLLSSFELADVPAFDAWLELERSSLERQWLEAKLSLLTELEEKSQVKEALDLLESLRKHDFLDEELLQRHLRLLAKLKRPQDALEIYRDFSHVLMKEMGAYPLESSQALADSIIETKPAVKKAALPAQTTAFIGRQQELNELVAKLADPGCRLLSIVGIGGIGKTRLALELARLKQDVCADGVYFVPLASVQNTEQLVAVLAQHLGLPFSTSVSPDEQLREVLKDKEILLILDNFEQLSSHASFLEILLEDAPRLKLLVTTRETLGLKSESLYDLYGLQVSDGEDSEALRLFCDRAERVSKSFLKTKETLSTVAELCRLVEGMPLAIELAASWTRSLSVQEILGHLSTNLTLLSNPYRASPVRQQSVLHIFDYSLEQLPLLERRTLTKLCIFKGSFDLRAAEAISGIELNQLLVFINHCLLRRRSDGRYEMHGLLQHYLRKLLSPEQEAELGTTYSHYYLKLLGQSEALLTGEKPKTALLALTSELDNLRQAFALSLSHKCWDELEKTEPAMRLLFMMLGAFQEAYQFYDRVLTTLQEQGARVKGCQLQFLLGQSHLAYCLSKVETFSRLEALIKELRQEERQAQLAEALCLKTQFVQLLGVNDEASVLEALTLSQKLESPELLQQSYQTYAWFSWHLGKYEQGLDYSRLWCELSEQRSDTHQLARALLSLNGTLYLNNGSRHERKAILDRVVALEDELCSYELRCNLLDAKAVFAFEEGDYFESEQLFRQGLEMHEKSGNKKAAGIAAYNLARSLREQGRFTEVYEALEHSYRNLPVMLSLADFGETARLEKHAEKATGYFVRALCASLENDYDTFQVFRCLLYLAQFYADQGRFNDARNLACYIRTQPQSGERNKSHANKLLENLPEKDKNCPEPGDAPLLKEMLEGQLKILGPFQALAQL